MSDADRSMPAPSDAPHDCSEPKKVALAADDDLAERYGLGQPGSEEARQHPPVRFERRESRPYFVR